MAALSWIICIAAFLGAFVAASDLSASLRLPLSCGLILACLLTCPLIWRNSAMAQWISGRQRALVCLTMILALPLILIPA